MWQRRFWGRYAPSNRSRSMLPGCPKPRPPSYAGGVVFPVTPPGPLAHSVRRRFFCGVTTCKRRASSRLRSSRYQASSIACRCCSKHWRLAGDNSWYSRPETSKLSIVTETKFCFCFWGSKRSRLWRSVAGTQHEVPISKVEGILQIRKK